MKVMLANKKVLLENRMDLLVANMLLGNRMEVLGNMMEMLGNMKKVILAKKTELAVNIKVMLVRKRKGWKALCVALTILVGNKTVWTALCVALENENVLKVLSCIVLETLICDVWVSQMVCYSSKKERILDK